MTPEMVPKFKTDQLAKVWEATSQGPPKVWEANSQVSHFSIKTIFVVLPKVTSQGLGHSFPRSLPKVWEAVHYKQQSVYYLLRNVPQQVIAFLPVLHHRY